MARKTVTKTVTKKTTSYKPGYVKVTKPGKAPTYKNNLKAPTYKTTAEAPDPYQIRTFNSRYQPQIDQSLNTITNWKYDPMQDASYQALAKIYGARGNQAAKDTMADAAALNGGYGTSYAVSAAQQARNQYNQELASMIPDLEQTAFNRATTTYNALRDADDTDYTRFRDTEGDRQWKYTQDYGAYRDQVGDDQWLYSQNYQKYRDKVGDKQWLYDANYKKYQDALSQYQWALDYNNTMYSQLQKTTTTSSGGGGGGRGGSGGGGGYSGGGSSGGSDTTVSDAPKRPTRKGWGGMWNAKKATDYAYSTSSGTPSKLTVADFQKKVSKKK